MKTDNYSALKTIESLRRPGTGAGIRFVRTVLCLAAVCLTPMLDRLAASALPPDRMTYQGFIVDSNGDPLAPATPLNYPIIFRIYSEAQGDSPLWTEQQIVTVDRGNFSVLLGEGTAVGSESMPPLSSVFAGSTASDRYLGVTVTVDGDPMEITPRLRLMPAPYAFLATSAASLVQPNGTSIITVNGTRADIAGGASFSGASASLFIPEPLAASTVDGAINLGGTLFLDGDEIQSTGELSINRLSGADILLAQGGGQVGIGLANPTARLHVNGNIRVVDDADIFGLDQIVGYNDLRIYGSPGGNPDVYISNSGLMGLGTTGPGAALHIAHPSRASSQWGFLMDNTSNFSWRGGIRMGNTGFFEMTNNARNGNPTFARLSSAGSWSSSSDRRLKKDIVPADGFLDGALRLQPVRYRFQNEASSQPQHLGFIAQDVRAEFPEFVEGEDHMTLDYGGLSVVAIGAVKELHDRVEALEKENAELRRAIDQILQTLNRNATAAGN